MKKGLTMLVVAMVIFALVNIIGSAAATAVEAAPISSVATTTVMIVFGIMTIGVALYVAMSAKKGHTDTNRPGRLVKALNGIVHRMMVVVNARYAFTHIARAATSPRMISRAYGNHGGR